MRRNIYFAHAGDHVRCRVFVNGACAGKLCFRIAEWDVIGPGLRSVGWNLIDETKEAA